MWLEHRKADGECCYTVEKEATERYFYLMCIRAKSPVPVFSEGVWKGTMKVTAGKQQQ